MFRFHRFVLFLGWPYNELLKMDYFESRHCLRRGSLIGAVGAWAIALAACLCIFTARASAQQKVQESPLPQTPVEPAVPDTVMPQINTAIQGVTTPDISALADALHIGGKLEDAPPEVPRNSLVAIGDLDGDGVPEVLLRWAVPDNLLGADVAPDPSSQPLWNVYMLSWDGAHWKASRLISGVENFSHTRINLGPTMGCGLAIVVPGDESQAADPMVFQVKDHVATLLWDGQAEDSRLQPLLQAQVKFLEQSGAASEMIVTGRADPGLLQFPRGGKRGFDARAVYHWDGKAFIPAKTEYVANQDYTLYRFISALHLHDYSAAYALVVPAKFLNADSPSLESFRKFVQDNWPEFLQDNVFRAAETLEGTPDRYLFALSKPDQRFVYHPIFTNDGKFLLTGLTRSREALPAEPQ